MHASQHKNYSNVIQKHALQDQQCLVFQSLDNKPITILIDTGSYIGLLDEQLYYSLSSVPPLQSILFSVAGADDKHLIALGKTSFPLLLTTAHFKYNLLSLGIFFSLWYWELTFYRHIVELSVFQLLNYTSSTPLLNQLNHPYIPITHTIHSHHHAHTQYIPPMHTHFRPTQ